MPTTIYDRLLWMSTLTWMLLSFQLRREMGGGRGGIDGCPTEVCVCLAEDDIECSEMYMSSLPKFIPSMRNTTYLMLDLSGNRIGRLGADAFRYVHVKNIKMWKNARKGMNISQRALRGLENDLEKITIRKSNIPIIPSKLFSNLSRLRSIDLPGNHIISIRRGAFRDAGAVELLNLESNNLTELGENVFGGLTGLKVLKLAKNEISMIDSRAFEALTSLENLDLRHNHIRDLQPKVFSQLSRLTRLDLSNNQIPALFPVMFKGLNDLDTLILTHNPIIMIARETFLTMSKLKDLRLEKSKLTYLKPGVFDGLISLRSLRLYSNKLRTLPDGLFFNLKSLKRIELDDNDLTTLNACAFEDITTIAEISLVDNPIHCDCAMTWTSLGGTAKIRGKCAWPPVTLDQDISNGDKYHVCRYTGLEECKHLRKHHSNDVTLFRYYRHV